MSVLQKRKGAHNDTAKSAKQHCVESDANETALDPEQQRVVDCILAGRNVFLTGEAGVGKSLCIGQVVHDAVALKWKVAVTATTGLAAQGLAPLVERDNIVPMTVHRFSGLVPNEYNVDALVRRVQKNRYLAKRWKETALWVIDEVSMLSPVIFVLLDRMARALRSEPSKSFGGITMLFVGDFFQLPPVMIDPAERKHAQELAAVRYKQQCGKADEEDESDEQAVGARDMLEYCFETREWRNAVDCAILLRRVYRQNGDDQFIGILNEVRHAKLSDASAAALRARTFDALYADLVRLADLDPANMPDIDVAALRAQLQSKGRDIPPHLQPLLGDIEPTKLMSRNALVNMENEARLAEMSGESVFYDAQCACEGSGVRSAQQSNALCRQMESGMRAPKRLKLRLGAQVMLLASLSATLVNGSRGVLVDYCEQKFDGDMSAPNSDLLPVWARVSGCAPDEALLWPLVRFDNGEERVVTPYTWLRRSKSPRWRTSYTQVPLQLAWGMSIHKSQGMSISLLTVDLQQLFASGQAYVALSRARSLNGLMLESFEPRMCTDAAQAPNRKVLRYYRALERMQNREKS